MERKTNESYLDYTRRCTDALNDKLIDYSEWGDSLLGCENVYSSDNLRKAFYVVSKILPKLDISQFSSSSEEEELRLEELQKEIIKEKIKFRDQRRELQKYVTAEARFENLIDILKEKIKEDLPILQIEKDSYESNIDNEAALILSDVHYGLNVDNVNNIYSPEIAKERIEKLCEKTIEYCKLHKVNILHLNLGGDLVNGIIQLQSRIDAEEDVITQTIEISEILSQFIQKLLNNIPCVKVYGVIGNHGRVNEDKKKNLGIENFEKFVFKFIQMRLPNVNIITNGKEDWLTYKIKDRLVFLSHGDKDTLSNAKNHVVGITGQVPQEIFLGHVHHLTLKDDDGTDIITNGSVISTDSYSMNLRCNSQPYQILRVYNGNKDILTYKVILD